MYEIDRITEPADLIKAATRHKPAGPAFELDDAQRAAALIVQGTTASSPGADFTRWTLVDSAGGTIATTDVPGY